MNNPLSPAAQFILHAANGASSYSAADVLSDARPIAAAVLRATADRTDDLISDTCHPRFREGVEAAEALLESIATELEAPNA